MKEASEFHVKIGEVRTARSPDILKATLGTCVGILFHWKEKELYALAHCLLPEIPNPTYQIGAKYVDQAIPSLLSLMRAHPEDYSKIQAVIAGGGNVMDELTKRNPRHIGIQNSDKAIEILKRLKIKIIRSEVGGDHGRQIKVDCASGAIEIRKITVPASDETE